MRNKRGHELIEVAMLPLGDGRQVMMPLQALAEVLVLSTEREKLSWRGLELVISTLDALCGLAEPPPIELTTVAVMKAHKDSDTPFRAIAFTGNAAHARISAEDLQPCDVQPGGGFVGAVTLMKQDYLIPDLIALTAA
jgi:hypothetical protein